MPIKPFYPSNSLPPVTRFRGKHRVHVLIVLFAPDAHVAVVCLDLVIFDERLKQNYHSLSKVKRRHESKMMPYLALHIDQCHTLLSLSPSSVHFHFCFINLLFDPLDVF